MLEDLGSTNGTYLNEELLTGPQPLHRGDRVRIGDSEFTYVGPLMLRVAEHFERTDTGRQRRANEDAFFARAPLFAVADGMGGAQAGEVASHLAVEVLEQGLPDGGGSVEERLRARVSEANARIHELSRRPTTRAPGMGTTLTAAYVGEDELDRRPRRRQPRSTACATARFERLTDDHSLVEELVRQGKLTPEEADEHPQRSIITRALGPEAERRGRHAARGRRATATSS